MKVLVFDTETTGLPTERNPSITETEKWPHVVQLSYILYDVDENKILTICDELRIHRKKLIAIYYFNDNYDLNNFSKSSQG